MKIKLRSRLNQFSLKKHYIKAHVLGCILLCGLSGCHSDGDHAKLREYIDQVRHRAPTPIEPLPEVRPSLSYKYEGSQSRDPFEKPVHLKVSEEESSMPDSGRLKEPLEAFPLDSLKMVGTLSRGDSMWALILDTDGTVHRLKVGDHLGQNYGKVIEITNNSVSIMETIPDGQGGWLERAASIALSE